jgi:hypothetical protein
MRSGARTAIAVLAAAVLAAVVGVVATTAGASTPPTTTINLQVAKAYQPKAQPGTTDDYHCTLVDPHVTRNAYVISSQFHPGSVEDHHAALFLVPPNIAQIARRNHTIGKGWTCFGEAALPGTTLAQFLQSPYLAVWAPGHGADVMPAGTGIALPTGSLVIMQVHYNMLAGTKPVKDSLTLRTVPMTKAIQPLRVGLTLAPPDLACPAGVTGPLCTRDASLADQGVRFGPSAVQQANGIESLCGHDPATAPASDTATCTSTVGADGWILRSQAHMHLLGTGFSLVLNPGTPGQRTILDVPHYNFDYQQAYLLKHPIAVKKGDTVRVTCTYDPTLAQKLPRLRKAPAHYVTWGDGSSDEMCIGLTWMTSKLPAAR